MSILLVERVYSQTPCNYTTTCKCYKGNVQGCSGTGDLLPDLSPSYIYTEENHSYLESFSKIQFGTLVANIGEGPLELVFTTEVYCVPELDLVNFEPSANTSTYNAEDVYDYANSGDSNIPDDHHCTQGWFPPNTHSLPLVNQKIYKKDGTTRVRSAGYTTYTHADHEHLHWENWILPSFRIGDGDKTNWMNWPILANGTKTEFALIDYWDVFINPQYVIPNCYDNPNYCLQNNASNNDVIAETYNVGFGGLEIDDLVTQTPIENGGNDDSYQINDYGSTELDVAEGEIYGGISVGSYDIYSKGISGHYQFMKH